MVVGVQQGFHFRRAEVARIDAHHHVASVGAVVKLGDAAVEGQFQHGFQTDHAAIEVIEAAFKAARTSARA